MRKLSVSKKRSHQSVGRGTVSLPHIKTGVKAGSAIGGNRSGYANFEATINNLDQQGKANLAEAGAHADSSGTDVGEAAR